MTPLPPSPADAAPAPGAGSAAPARPRRRASVTRASRSLREPAGGPPSQARLRGEAAARLARGWLGSVTSTGWALAGAGALAAAVAAWVGWREAAAVAIVAAVCLAAAVVSVIGRNPHEVDVVLPQDRTVAGQTVVGRIQVRNARGRRVAPGVIELQVGAGAAPFLVPSLEAHGRWSEVFAVPTRRRGVIVLGPARSVRGDALGLVRREREWSEPVRLRVHPRTVRLDVDATGFQADTEGVATARLSSSDVSFHALRDYVPGDDRRHVHWATSARLGRLVVRQYEETRRSHHVLLLDTDRAHWAGEDFELAVSVTASMALSGVARRRLVSVATSTGWVQTSSPVRLLDELTEVEPVDGAGVPSLAARVEEVLGRCPGASVLTVVVGPETTDAEVAHLATLAGVDLVVEAVRVGLDRAPRRARAGAARVLDCPDLADLPRMVARGGLA